jgi:hypothetical protein
MQGQWAKQLKSDVKTALMAGGVDRGTLRQEFAKFDANNDGTLSIKEMIVGLRVRPARPAAALPVENCHRQRPYGPGGEARAGGGEEV